MKDQCSAFLKNSEDGCELDISFSPVHLGFNFGQAPLQVVLSLPQPFYFLVCSPPSGDPTLLVWSTEVGPHIKD